MEKKISAVVVQIKGRNLASKDSNGLSDPYLVIKLDDQHKEKTRTIYKTLNPIWNELFQFYVDDIEESVIKFKCWDSDKYTQDDFMGRFHIEVKDLVNSPELYEDRWFKLEARKLLGVEQVVSGDIHLKIEVKAATPEDRAKVDHFMQHKRLRSSRAHQQNKQEDATATPQLPFRSVHEKFAVSANRSPRELLYELICHCVYHPLILEESLAAPPRLTPTSKELASIREALGISSEVDSIVRARVEKFAPGKEPLLIELQYRLATLDCHPFNKEQNFETKEAFKNWKQNEITTIKQKLNDLIFQDNDFYGSLTITAVEAKNLESKDLNGFSDPYCIFKVEAQRERTKMKRKTLNPVWNESFHFDICYPSSIITVRILDKDFTSKDDVIDEITIPLTQFITNNVKPCDKWFPLKQGSIHLQFLFDYPYAKYVRFMEEMVQGSLSEESNAVMVSVKNQPVVNFYELYTLLVKTLFQVSKGGVPSTECHVALNEFEARFGISTSYSLLTYLQLCTLQPRLDSIEEVENKFTDFQQIPSAHLAKEEKKMHLMIKDQIFASARKLLVNYKDLFPKNFPAGAVRSLCSILMLLGDDEASRISLISSSVQEGTKARYEAVKSKIKEQRNSGVVVPAEGLAGTEMLLLLEAITEHINADNYFKDAFPKQLNYLSLVTKHQYDLFSKDIEHYCSLDVFSEETFQLYFKLRDFHDILQKKLSKDELPLLDLMKLFIPFVYTWMKVTLQQELQWIKNAISIDKKVHLSEPTVLSSSSVVDVFSSLSQNYNFLEKLGIRDSFSIISQFAMIVEEIVTQYAKSEYEELNGSIKTDTATTEPQHSHEHHHMHSDVSHPFKVSVQECICINNIDATRDELDKFYNTLEEKFANEHKLEDQEKQHEIKEIFDQVITETFKSVKEQLSKSIELLAGEVYHTVHKKLMEKLTNENDLLEYLDEQLVVLSDHLYPDLFKKVLQSLWQSISVGLKEIILETKEKSHQLTFGQTKQLVTIFESLREYFYADGKGLEEKFLDDKTAFVRKMLELSQKPTGELLTLYNELKKSKEQNPEAVNADHILLLLKARKDDKEAIALLQEINKKHEDKPHKGETKPAMTEDDKLRAQLMLSDNEIIIDTYSVTNDGHPGKLVLSSSYVLFDTFFAGGPDNSNQIAIKLKEIKSITRHGHIMWETIEIALHDDTKYKFNSIANREGMIKDILFQAKKIGNTISTGTTELPR